METPATVSPTPAEPRLMKLLRAEAARRGQSLSQLAQALGVTQGYLSLLGSRRRHVENVNSEFIQRSAEYLGVARIVVKFAAGIVDLSDFVESEVQESLLVERLFSDVRRDPEFGAVWPGGEAELSCEQRRFVAYCYLQAMMNCIALPRDETSLFSLLGTCLGKTRGI